MRDLDSLFNALEHSRFRSGFELKGRELAYLREKGLPVVMAHADDFIQRRLAPAVIPNDGKQTPYRGHPVFVAQHATACCCRSCLQQWHHIPAGTELSETQRDYVLKVLERWLKHQLSTG